MEVSPILNNPLSRVGGVGLEVGSKKNDQSMPKIRRGTAIIILSLACCVKLGREGYSLRFARTSSLQHKFRA